MSNHYKIAPSDITFLYHGCKHCFFNKVRYGISQPSIPLPGIFTIIASLQKEFFSEKRTEAFCPELPPGQVLYGEKWVQSQPISFSGTDSSCYIKGRFDIVIKLDDGTFVVGDFKTGNPNEEKSLMYGRQLHSYAYALEKPDEGALSLGPISKLGLIYFSPDKCDLASGTRQILEGSLTWIEIARNDDDFLRFLNDVVVLLDGESPPPDPDNCDWCNYRKLTGETYGRSDRQSIAPNCPKCGHPMQLKTGKYGEFWSCTKFPDCRGTRRV
jgi:hypothetical protein